MTIRVEPTKLVQFAYIKGYQSLNASSGVLCQSASSRSTLWSMRGRLRTPHALTWSSRSVRGSIADPNLIPLPRRRLAPRGSSGMLAARNCCHTSDFIEDIMPFPPEAASGAAPECSLPPRLSPSCTEVLRSVMCPPLARAGISTVIVNGWGSLRGAPTQAIEADCSIHFSSYKASLPTGSFHLI